MNAKVTTYIFGEPNIALGRFIPIWVAYIIGASISIIVFGIYLFTLFRFKKKRTAGKHSGIA